MLTRTLQEIRDYTAQHDELTKAHHFLFDLKAPVNCTPEYVVIGINPGERDECWRHAPRQALELTSAFDYHAGTAYREGIKWGIQDVATS